VALGFLSRLSGGIFGNAIGYGVGTGLGAALEPAAQGIRNEIWPLDPNVPLSPEILATMVVQGVIAEAEGADEAKLNGVNPDRFHKLFRVNGDPVAPEMALSLWNRGEISEADVRRALLQSRLKPEWVDDFMKLRNNVIGSADLAEMVVQNIVTLEEGIARARKNGDDEEEFRKYVRLAGNPPGPAETLSLWNRGILNETEATLALRQSRLKPEWIEQFKQGRFHPVTASQAVEGVIKQRITLAEGTAIAAENGIDAGSFKLMVDAAGRPIGTVQALTLYNRGEFSRADVEEVVARSNVRTEYTDDIIKLAVRYPSLFQLRSLIQNGAIDDAYATELITKQGYPAKLAKGIVQAAHSQKLQNHKDLTVSQIEALYQGEAISRADAVAMLEQLDYDARESAFILDLADFRRIARFEEAVINKLHSQFVNHRIDVDVITATLDKLAIPEPQRENLIDLWSEERAANVKVLTPAQIVKAVRKGILPAAEGTAELTYQGYSDRDAAILLQL
jgi:hypothetical protein